MGIAYMIVHLYKKWKYFAKEIFNILKNSFVKNDKEEIFKYGIISLPEHFESFLIEQGLL
jgi:hypothetical protein